MFTEELQTIRQAEEQADALRRDAKAEAAKLIKDANTKAGKMADEAETKANATRLFLQRDSRPRRRSMKQLSRTPRSFA